MQRIGLDQVEVVEEVMHVEKELGEISTEPKMFHGRRSAFKVNRRDTKQEVCQDLDPLLLMTGPNNLVRRTSVALQKVQQKHRIDLAAKRAGIKRCRERGLRMIKHDARIGVGFDFKAGGIFEDMTFEKERTLLQLWDLYRNGYTPDQVLATMYVPIIVIDNGGRVRCKAERGALDETMISELRARYQGIKEEDMIQREQNEAARYNDLHGISRLGAISAMGSNLLDTVSGSPKHSRPHSMLSHHKDSSFNRSTEEWTEGDGENLLSGDQNFRYPCPIIYYCCYTCLKTED
ncbi:uncharacterized protein LOC134825229 isoform X2 [Bolinopsis microptera]